jgi:hypothetical protein
MHKRCASANRLSIACTSLVHGAREARSSPGARMRGHFARPGQPWVDYAGHRQVNGFRHPATAGVLQSNRLRQQRSRAFTCRSGACVLDFHIQLSRERTVSGLSRVATPALAGLLGLMLLVSGAVSVSNALHQLLHHDASDGSHFCLVCSIAKGHVTTAVVATSPAPRAVCFISTRLAAHAAALLGFDYRISPSRAPPLS